MCICATHSTKDSNEDPILLDLRMLLPGYGNIVHCSVVTVYQWTRCNIAEDWGLFLTF